MCSYGARDSLKMDSINVDNLDSLLDLDFMRGMYDNVQIVQT